MQPKVAMTAIFIFFICCISICYAGELYQAEVVKLSDADSMWVRINGMKVKLNVLGIDAPEEYKSRKMRRDARRCHMTRKHIRRLGRIATAYARSILSKGEKVKIKIHKEIYKVGEKEIYGLLFLPDEHSYGEEIVKEGYACVSDELEEEELSRLKELLQEAKKNKRGLWNKYYKEMNCLCKQGK